MWLVSALHLSHEFYWLFGTKKLFNSSHVGRRVSRCYFGPKQQVVLWCPVLWGGPEDSEAFVFCMLKLLKHCSCEWNLRIQLWPLYQLFSFFLSMISLSLLLTVLHTFHRLSTQNVREPETALSRLVSAQPAATWGCLSCRLWVLSQASSIVCPFSTQSFLPYGSCRHSGQDWEDK